MAQEMLVPGGGKIAIPIPAVDQGVAEQSIDIASLIQRAGAKTGWRAYYTSGSSGSGRTAQSPLVSLGAMEQVPSTIGGPDVTTYKKGDGVWHPDAFNSELFWAGGNPFAPIPVPAVA